MKTLQKYTLATFVTQTLLTAQAQLGEICQPDAVPPQPGLVAQATDEWTAYPASIVNAKKGDILLGTAAGMILDVLTAVAPPQKFSHSGIVVQRVPMLVKHSTASPARIEDSHIGGLASGAQLNPVVLRYGWPGTVTNTVQEAFEGFFLTDPESHGYGFQSFNPGPFTSGDHLGVVPPTVVQPAPFDEFYDWATRTVLEGIADYALRLHGHYRFYVYTRADLVGDSRYWPTDPTFWAYGPHREATVCSSFIWSAARLAGVDLEDPVREVADPASGLLERAHADDPDLNGLYQYTPEERQHAGEALYSVLYNKVVSDLGSTAAGLHDNAQRIANQVCNTFASDHCEAAAPEDEGWKHPGAGVAVSPDDITHWDGPPNGVYGHKETSLYRPSHYVRVYRWARAAGTGDVQVDVSWSEGGPAPDARVEVRGIGVANTGGCVPGNLGRACFSSVPAGRYEVEVVKLSATGLTLYTASDTVDVPAGGTANLALVLSDVPPPPPPVERWDRRINITGHISGVEDDFPINTPGTGPALDFTVLLNRSHPNQDLTLPAFCVQNEVRIEATLHFALLVDTDRPDVRVTLDAKLFEGISCATEDLDDSQFVLWGIVPEDRTSYPLNRSLHNHEWMSDDSGTISLQMDNVRSTP